MKLGGIAIVVVGLALRWRTTVVVLVAALVTGIAAGLPLFSDQGVFHSIPFLTKPGQEGIINTLGKEFVKNRLMTLFIITLPAIGLSERFGLQEQSAALIRRISAATVGRLQIVYQFFRVLIGITGIRVNGHPSFVRPMVFPMSVGAAEAALEVKSADDVPEELVEEIKAANAASENYGNFYGQNLNPVQAGILLVLTNLNGVMEKVGYDKRVDAFTLVLFAIPITSISVILGAAQFLLFDRRIKRRKAAGNRS